MMIKFFYRYFEVGEIEFFRIETREDTISYHSINLLFNREI